MIRGNSCRQFCNKSAIKRAIHVVRYLLTLVKRTGKSSLGNCQSTSCILTLLVLVAEPSGLIGPGGPLDPVNPGELTVLPAANTEQISHDIALLFAIKFGHVLIRAHDDSA